MHVAYHTHGQKPPSVEGELRPRFELASPFGPDATEVAPDSYFAPDVLHILRDGWEDMRANHPDFYVGMTVYGSMVKGRAHEDSDVDAIVFFDPDAQSVRSLDNIGILKKPNADILSAIAGRFKEKGYAKTFQGVGSYGKVAMNEAIINHALAGGELGGPLTPDAIPKDIMHLFCMRIGSGNIPNYRKYVLDKVSQLENGEQIWQGLMSDLALYEETRRGAKIYLPPTIKDGYDYFRVQPTEELRVASASESVIEKPTLLRKVGKSLVNYLGRVSF